MTRRVSECGWSVGNVAEVKHSEVLDDRGIEFVEGYEKTEDVGKLSEELSEKLEETSNPRCSE